MSTGQRISESQERQGIFGGVRESRNLRIQNENFLMETMASRILKTKGLEQNCNFFVDFFLFFLMTDVFF